MTTTIQLTNARARATAAALDPLRYAGPVPGNREEASQFAGALAYLAAYYDTCRDHGITPVTVPDGWAFAYVEYKRRDMHPVSMGAAFRAWRDHGTLPGLD